jgi:uncharacterized integral membrane protein
METMLRILRLLLGLVGLLLITLFAIANRAPVDVSFWPTPLSADVPLYGVFLIGLMLGVIVTALIAAVDLLRLRLENRRLSRQLHGFQYQAKLRESAEEKAAVQRIRDRSRATALTLSASSS